MIAWLVRQGHAWAFDRYLEEGPLLPDLEAKARAAVRSLWTAAEPVPPWQWRQGARHGNADGGRDRDYSDFGSQAEAQRFFEAHQPGDPHHLDGNADGEACEGLP